jgi:hypothetical protein
MQKADRMIPRHEEEHGLAGQQQAEHPAVTEACGAEGGQSRCCGGLGLAGMVV